MPENVYKLNARDIPLDASYDVIVTGGGPAGCAAAASSARNGANTLLIERCGFLGGMGVGGLVPAWCPFTDGEKIIYGGLASEVFHQLKRQMPQVPEGQVSWVPIDAEKLKIVYDDLVKESGADILFETILASAELDKSGEWVDSIICGGKSGLRALRAKVYIDCTGDADLAAWAGAEFHLGAPDTGLMPATHCFILAGVDEDAYRNGPPLYQEFAESPIYEILSSGDYPLIPDSHLCNNLVGPGAVGFNAGHIWDVSSDDPKSVSDALTLGRKMAQQYRDGLARFFPAAFANSYVAQTAPLMGIRESRRIVGEYCLTVDDYIARRSFPDEIARNSYFLDIHETFEKTPKKLEDLAEWRSRILRYNSGESHGIPYRCLIPKGFKNLLVGGRTISCARAVQGAVRIMPSCLTTGEAAGAAASLALLFDGDVKEVDPDSLRELLRSVGAYLP